MFHANRTWCIHRVDSAEALAEMPRVLQLVEDLLALDIDIDRPLRAGGPYVLHRTNGAPANPISGTRPASARFTFRTVLAGNCASFAAGRMGRRTSSPPQLGQRPARTPSAQPAQKVHSNEQIRAARLSGGRSAAQHSQQGRSSSMAAA